MEKNKIKKSIKYSNIEGSFGNAMVGFFENYITPYALAMNATNRQIGMLSALPNLFASLVQLKSADVVDKIKSRKKIVTISVLLQALMFIPIILIPFMLKENLTRIYALVAFVSLYTAFGSFGGPAYGSMVSGLVKDNERGRFFGYRGKIFGIILIISMFIAGYVLNLFNEKTLFGFTIIFTIAMICRFLSYSFLKKMHDPAMDFSKDGYFSFLEFYKRLKQSNFAKFTLYVSLITFTINLAGPFFSVYVLKDLGFNYLIYTVWVVIASIASLITMTYWGKRADSLGNIKILRATSIIVPLIPALYLFSKQVYWLMFIQIISGIAWAGFNLSAGNFIYDSSIPEKRARCIAYFNVSNGFAFFAGALSGGFIIRYLPLIFGSKLLSLFLLSGILRGLVAIIMIPMIKEVRKIKGIGTDEIHYLAKIREMDGIVREFFRLKK